MRLCGCRYNASDGNNHDSKQPSGAYIFRPNSSTPFAISRTAQTESVQVGGRRLLRAVFASVKRLLVHPDRRCFVSSEAGGAGSEAALRSLGVPGGPAVRQQQSCGAGVDRRTAARPVSAFLSPCARQC